MVIPKHNFAIWQDGKSGGNPGIVEVEFPFFHSKSARSKGGVNEDPILFAEAMAQHLLVKRLEVKNLVA
jgi:hypothetical protein